MLSFHKTILTGLVLWLAAGFFPAVPAIAEPFDDALGAYEKGDYEMAEGSFRALAVQSHSGAETMLGVLYFHGRGVEENKAHAAIWFYKAARKGNPNAQLAFGALHIRGIGVRQNVEKAYRWLSLASLHGGGRIHDEAERLKAEIAGLLSDRERAEIAEDAKSWRPVANRD